MPTNTDKIRAAQVAGLAVVADTTNPSELSAWLDCGLVIVGCLDADADKRSRFAGLPTPVSDLAEGDSATVWDALNGEQRREVVRSLMTIRVNPVTHVGSLDFEPEAIVIEWKR